MYPIDFVPPKASCGLKLNLVSGANVLQVAEECIAMSGDSDVSGFSWESGTLNMSNANSQSPRGSALKNCHGQSEPWNLNATQDIAFFGHC